MVPDILVRRRLMLLTLSFVTFEALKVNALELLDSDSGLRLSILDSTGKEVHAAEMGRKLTMHIRLENPSGNQTILPQWCKISSDEESDSKSESLIPFIQGGCPLDLLPVVVYYPKRINATNYISPFNTFVFSPVNSYVYVHCEVSVCDVTNSEECTKECWDRIPVPQERRLTAFSDGDVESPSNDRREILSAAIKVFEDPCQGSPCQNNGTCISDKGSEEYRCECPDQWLGPDCSYSACHVIVKNVGAYVLWTEFHNNRNAIEHRYVAYGNSILIPSIAGGQVITGAVWGRSKSCLLTNTLCAKPVWITCHGTSIFGFDCTCVN